MQRARPASGLLAASPRIFPLRLSVRAVQAIAVIARRLAAILLLAAVAGPVAIPAGPTAAHQGNPSFRSVIGTIQPGSLARGLKAEVVNFDDHVVLQNRSGKDVAILGYKGEPYARLSADGTVEVNLNAPTYYLNEDRYADVELPARADAAAAPAWKEVSTDGRFEWHDHRSHYMSQGVPPQVKDESVRTPVFDYEIPITVGGKSARIEGTLYWQGRDDGFPVAPFAGLAAVVVIGGGLLLWRRRRDTVPDEPSAGGRGGH